MLPMLFIFLILSWIGCGFPRTTLLFSSRVKPRVVESSSRRIGKLWAFFGSTSQKPIRTMCSQGAIVALKKIVMPARTTLGGGALSLPISTGRASKDVNIDDSVEVALAGRLQIGALAHVAGSTSHAYVGPWNAFVLWCGSLMRPSRPLLANDLTVAIYF